MGPGVTFCSKTGPFFSCGCFKASRVPVCPRRPKPHSAAKQSRSFRVAALNWVVSLKIEKWTLECSCVPKGVGATFCSKTGPFFSCGCFKASRVPVCPRRPKPHSAAKQGRSFRVVAPNHPGSLCAQGGPSHILQQNRAVLFLWLL